MNIDKVILLGLGAIFNCVLSCAEDGFACGRPLRGDSEKAQRCTAPLEVCVCATNSCARPDFQTEDIDGGLESSMAEAEETEDEGPCTLRYVDAPFARAEWAGRCVPEGHGTADEVLDQRDGANSFCPNRAIAQTTESANDNVSDSDSQSAQTDATNSGTQLSDSEDSVSSDMLDAGITSLVDAGGGP